MTKILSLNSIKPMFYTKKTTTFLHKVKSGSCTNKNGDIVNISNFQGNLSYMLLSVVGYYSSNDLKKIEKYKKKYSKLSEDEMKTLHAKTVKQYRECILGTKGVEKLPEKDKEPKYSYNPLLLSSKTQKKLKDIRGRALALKELITQKAPQLGITPYSSWFDTDIGVQNPIIAQTRYEHYFNKVLGLTGSLNEDDYVKIQKLVHKYKNLEISQIWDKKMELLTKLDKFFNIGNPDMLGNYSDSELSKMKNLAINWYALNSVQKQKGVQTKALESVLFSKPLVAEKGAYVEGLGMITDCVDVNGKPTIIIYAKEGGKTHNLSMYNKQIFDEREKFLNNLHEDIFECNKAAEALIQKEKNSAMIASISFSVLDSKLTKKSFKVAEELESEVDSLLGNKQYSYEITNFINFEKKEFPSAGKVLGIRVLKLLKDNNAYPIFITARPFVGTHSPASMYLRIGFEPLSSLTPEVLKLMEKSEYKGDELCMYAPNFDKIGEKIDLMSRVYFPNTGGG